MGTERTGGNGDGERITIYKEKERRYKIETNRRTERRREKKITCKINEKIQKERIEGKKIGR